MKTVMTTERLEEIRIWVHRHARPLEMARWRLHFENGAKEDFLSALSLYQNSDGGFGHAMEPDSWNPESSPYTTLTALDLLDETGMPDPSHPMLRGIFTYLETCPYQSENGWGFNIPSNDDHPHAPWWTYDPATNQVENIGVTTGLCGYILQYADKASSLHAKAVALTKRLISGFLQVADFGEMGLGGFCQLQAALQSAASDLHFPGEGTQSILTAFEGALRIRLAASVETDTAQWVNHVVRPSRYVKHPDSPFREALSDLLETELDYLIRTRPAGGVWSLDWSWFDNNDRYPKAYAVSETWWKSWTAIGNLLLLRNFGRM